VQSLVFIVSGLCALPPAEVVEVMRAETIASRGMLPQGESGTAGAASPPILGPKALAHVPLPKVTQACSTQRS
jgi:hypothetical protein